MVYNIVALHFCNLGIFIVANDWQFVIAITNFNCQSLMLMNMCTKIAKLQSGYYREISATTIQYNLFIIINM